MTLQRSVFAVAALAIGLTSQAAVAETIIFAGPGGSWQKVMEAEAIRPFEKICGCDVRYQAGTSNESLARVVATKGNPEIDVMYSGNLQQVQGANLGLFLPLDEAKVPNLKTVWPNLRTPGDINANLSVIGGGLIYNADIFKEKGFAAPTSYKDLARPEFKGHIALQPTANNYGLGLVLLMAKDGGGGAENIDPGFEMAKKLSESAVVYARNAADMSRGFQQGTVWIAWWGDVRANTLAKTFPAAKWVKAKEGIPPIFMGASVVKGTKVEGTAYKLIDYLLSKEVQERLAGKLSIGPTVTTAKLDPAVADKVIDGKDEVEALTDIDWNIVAAKKAEWIERWNREVQHR